MAFALIDTALFALSGLLIATWLFQKERLVKRVWLGLALGLLLLTWLPSLFAFFIGFIFLAQILALGTAILLGGVCVFFAVRSNGWKSLTKGFCTKDLGFLWTVVPLFVLGAYLLHTHILMPTERGVSVGQVTYGDLAMHLGFISSIAEQGVFPPQYSIFPGHTVNYPFLCETSASSLYLMGATLRQAYLISALYAYLLVLMGVWFFFREWLKTNRRAHIASLLFFFGSGFGFFYFFDLAKQGASLNTLLSGNYFSNFSWLLDGFYDTPTNLPTLGLRWVNPVVDMLIPQRATLFGWALLFPSLTLLHGFTFRNKWENILPLGIFAGALPLIHTHSFLALGVISAVYCLHDLISRFDRKRFFFWLIYAGIAVLLAVPQLFGFTFRQVSESSMVQLHWNWANEADSYLWFYGKNLGWLFLLLPIAFFSLSKRDRKVYLGPLVLWILSEILVFQPNRYDNNKLLFIWFAFTCGLVTKFLDEGFHRILNWIKKRSQTEERVFSLLCGAAVLTVLVTISLVVLLRKGGYAAWYTLCTLLLLLGLIVFWLIRAIPETDKPARKALLFVAATLPAILIGMILVALWEGYSQTTLHLSPVLSIGGMILLLLSLLLQLLILLRTNRPKQYSRAWAAIALHLSVYLLTLSMTLSSTMTILRELKSEYQVYSNSDLKVTEFIRDNTDADGIFLANSYHWNLVTPLTGRSIVTGTSTFLYYHGIQNGERERDVKQMFEEPALHKELFSKYHVQYVLISNAERYNYDLDESWFSTNCTKLFENDSATLYEWK